MRQVLIDRFGPFVGYHMIIITYESIQPAQKLEIPAGVF